MVGEDPRKHIHRYSEEFTHDFVELLRTSHREKSVPLNTFYQSYISDKQHIHMNATRFSSLREFAKYLGNTVVCRVTEDEGKGIYIAWVDNRADALRRRDANAKQERLRRSDEKHERETIQAQIARARQVANTVDQGSDDTLDGGEESPESKSFKGFVLAQRQPVTTSAIETPTSKPEAKNIFSTVKRQRQMEDISLARCLKKRRIR